MDAVVMCGGRGTRLQSSTEKPLFEIGGEPMVERVLSALTGSDVDSVYAAVSPNTPATRNHLESRSVTCLDTPGDGYVEDLQSILDGRKTPLVTVAADLPLLTPEVINSFLDSHNSGPVGIYIPAEVKQALSLSHDLIIERNGQRLVPTGVNIVDSGEETTHVTHDVRLAVNVNRRRDARVAEGLL